jgi:hypothetical protein
MLVFNGTLVVDRMFAAEPTPQETDDLCDRLFNSQN